MHRSDFSRNRLQVALSNQDSFRSHMCARYTLTAPASRVVEMFDLDLEMDIVPRYNIAPTQTVLAVRLDENQQREYAWFRWGLVPSWAGDLKIGQRLINARSETVGEKPAFRDA